MTPNHNSLVAVISGTLNALKADLTRIHVAHSKEIQRDFETILRRLEHEGLPFVTSTLPLLGKAVLQSFRTGWLETPQGFRLKKGTTLPLLMSGLLVQGYDNRGLLKGDCSPQVIRSILQVCFLYYKLELPFTEQQIKRKVADFLQAELDLQALQLDAGDSIIRVAGSLISEIFREFNPKEIMPKHGPGALATGEKNEGKWVFKRKYKKLHAYYPYYEYFVPSRRSLFDRLKWYKGLIELEESTSMIRFVPKDSRGPRIISMESLEYQYIQQGIKDAIYPHIERHPLTKGFVNFTHQTVNQKLALEGSANDSWATLDMKEASDRVSLQLVRLLFNGTELLKAIEACRSDYAQFPSELGNHVIKLDKFAPMGSAMCFPIEALCFWALCKSILGHALGTLNRLEEIPEVYVYGDDVIVPKAYAKLIMDALPRYGLKVNTDKSFTDGPFRESCGYDCFKGEVVTPIKVRKSCQDQKASCEVVVSYSEYVRAFSVAGYYETSKYLRSLPILRKVPRIPWNLPYGVGIHEEDSLPTTRWSNDLQRKEYKGMMLVRSKRPGCVIGDARLLANLLKRWTRHVEVPYASNMKVGWFTPCLFESSSSWEIPEGVHVNSIGPKAVWDQLMHRARFKWTLSERGAV